MKKLVHIELYGFISFASLAVNKPVISHAVTICQKTTLGLAHGAFIANT